MSAGDKVIIKRDATGKLVYWPYVAPSAVGDRIFTGARDAIGQHVACKVEPPANGDPCFFERDAMAKLVALKTATSQCGDIYFVMAPLSGGLRDIQSLYLRRANIWLTDGRNECYKVRFYGHT